MEDATWLALTLALTVMAGTWTWFVARPKGAPALIRGAAITLLPPAAYLTGTLEAGVEIGAVLGDWATALVFSPKVWLGLVLAGLSALLFVLSGFLRNRTAGTGPTKAPSSDQTEARKTLPPSKPAAPAIDDDLAEIEAILKKRGIS